MLSLKMVEANGQDLSVAITSLEKPLDKSQERKNKTKHGPQSYNHKELKSASEIS